MKTPGEVTKPAVNIKFTEPGTGYLTQYAVSLLTALMYRTGGAGQGDSLEDIRVFVEGELQSDREAPVPNLIDPPEPPEDLPALLSIPAQQEDNPGIELLLAYIQRLESRIQHLEESR